MKNWLVATFAVPMLNNFLSRQGYDRIGHVDAIEINSRDKTITTKLVLQGEPGPVTAKVSGYSLEKKEGQYVLHWTSLQLSRPWMENAANKFLPNPIPLPGMTGKIISKLL